MIVANASIHDMLSAPSRKIKGKVELLNSDSTILKTFSYDGDLQSFTVDRTGGSNKFFGFGICQKLTAKILDKSRTTKIEKGQGLKVAIGVGDEYFYPYPTFFVDDVERDENTNDLTITAFDCISKTSNYTVGDLELTESYTIKQFTDMLAEFIGTTVNVVSGNIAAFDILYTTGANFDGKEVLRDTLNAIAEATQTIYYMNSNCELTFRQLDKDGDPVLYIPKSQYFTLSSKTSHTLSTIAHVTELGENVHATNGNEGSVQYVRENPFWDLREDIDTLLQDAINVVGGTTINQFDCNWRGNFLLEVGDKIGLTTKDNQIIFGYVMDDSIKYSGGYSENTKWDYENRDVDSTSNASTLGDSLRYTYARVDKAAKKIDLVVSDVESHNESISSLNMATNNINATVSRIEQSIDSEIQGITEEVTSIKNTVEAKMSADDVTLKITEELANGIDRVATTTGFTFDNSGLTIAKTDSEIKTQITEDGMSVYKESTPVLVANNEGVQAEDLHATTYLIIGNNSRFEDYGYNRTGCFWIGGE